MNTTDFIEKLHVEKSSGNATLDTAVLNILTAPNLLPKTPSGQNTATVKFTFTNP